MAIYGNVENLSAVVLAEVTAMPIHINGIGVGSVVVNASNHLIVTYTDGREVDAGEIDESAVIPDIAAIRSKAQLASTAVQPADLTTYAKSTDVPTKLSQLAGDSTHRVVTDADKARWDAGSGEGFDIHTLTTENSLADSDEMAFHDVSASTPRKTTWSNIKAKLKAYFDTVYNKVTKTSELTNDSGFLTSHQSLSGYATEQWVTNKGYGTYTKPSGGIPKSDLASAVQDSITFESNDGYCKLPDGTLIQWGMGSERVMPGTTDVNVTYPVEFASAIGPRLLASLTSPNSDVCIGAIGNTAADGSVVIKRAGSGVSTITVYFNWIAIGRWK